MTALSPPIFTVAPYGSGDFLPVQAAIDALPPNASDPLVLRIRPGVYKERLHLDANHPPITFRGDSPDMTAQTVLTYDWSAHRFLRRIGLFWSGCPTNWARFVGVHADRGRTPRIRD